MDYSVANTADSECSSGCESGWTSYLGNSFISPHENSKGNGSFVGKNCGFSQEKRSEEEEAEEDLSMVSDASSGPPHFPEEEEYLTNIDNADRRFYHSHAPLDATLCKNSSDKRQKFKENHCRKKKVHHEKPSLLDDTASSPAFDIDLPNKNFTFANNHASAETVLDFSQGHSTTHFQDESSAYHQDQYGFFHSSLSGNYLQQNQWFGSRRWQQ